MTTKHPPHVDLLIDARNIGSALIEIAGKIHMLSVLRPDRIEMAMAIRSLVLRDLEVHADKLMVVIADYKAAKPPFHTKEPTATPFTEEIV